MSIRVVFSEHSLIRIKERMCIGQAEVSTLLDSGLYSEVATVNTGIYENKYLVVWDEVKKKPFLLVLKAELGEWHLVTVYETFDGHRRKDSVVVEWLQITEARKKFCSNRDAVVRANKAINEASFFVALNVRYEASGRAMKSKLVNLGRVLISEYESHFKSDYRRLVAERLEAIDVGDVFIPSSAVVYCIFYKKKENKEPFFTEEL